MLLESSKKNMVKKEVKEPPKRLTSCNNRLDVEDCYLYHSIPIHLAAHLFQENKHQLHKLTTSVNCP